jgi:PAS domain S-box-containing protein
MTPNQDQGSSIPARVLHVDDEPDFMAIAARMLNSFDPLLQIDSTTSPREALEKLEKKEYDCIISDYKMPEMDGIQLAIRIREKSNIPFILYTGQGSEEVAEAAFAAGIDDYLRKEVEPAHSQVLARRIRAAVEKHRAESSLIDFKLGIDRSEEAIFLTDAEGAITYVNPSFEKTYGYSSREAVGKTPRILKSGVYDQEVYKQYWDTLLTKQVMTGEIVNKTKDGRLRTVFSSANPILDDEGRITGFLTIQRDISEQRALEERLRLSEERLRGFMDAATDGFSMFDSEMRYIDINRALEKRSGQKKEDIIGKSILEVIPGFKETGRYERYLDVIDSGEPVTLEAVQASDAAQYLSIRAFKVGDGLGLITTDITERRRMEEEMIGSEQRFRMLFEEAPIGVSLIDKEGHNIMSNRALSEMHGYSEEEFRAMTFKEYSHPDDVDVSWKNGREIWTKILVSSTRDVEGKPQYFIGMSEDITERKRIERELKQNEATLLALHRHAKDLAGCMSLGEVYEHTVRVMTETLRFPRVDILMVNGNVLKQVTASGSLPLGVQIPLDGKGVTVKAIREKRSQLINDVSESEDYIYALGGPNTEPLDGYPLSRAELVSPIIVEGEAVGVLNVENTHVDAFTEQNKMFLELLAMHVASAIERLGKMYELEGLIDERTTELLDQMGLAQTYLDVAQVIFLAISPEGEVLLLNQKGCDMLGYTQEEALGLNWFDTFIPPRIREDVIGLHHRGFAGNIESAEFYENPVLTKGGEERIIEWHNAYIRNSKGKAESSISSGIDITERREMQSALADSELMAAVGKVAAMVGHDLRGPLQTIKNAVYLLEKDPDTADKLRETIDESVNYAASMLEELRLNVGDSPLQLQEVNLGSIIRRALLEASKPDSVETEVHIADGLDSVHVDPLKIRRVLDNLVRNAMEAMPDGGNLDVSAQVDEEGLEMTVRDTGTGIPDDMMSDLFKAFVTSKPKGMGLGLPYCKRAIEAHGGSIVVESEVGVETTFTVRLPLEFK